MRSLSSDDIHYSPKGLFGQSKNLYCYQKWGLGRSPKRVVSRWCRCVVQRLCATDCKHPCLVRAAAPHSAPARMPGVYAQGLCTMQSQPSIHSLSPWERGLGIGIENKHFFEKTDFFYKLTARKGCFVLPVTIRAVPQYLRRDVSKERDSFLHRIPFLYQL